MIKANVRNTKLAIKNAIEENMMPIIIGYPGIGKTESVRQLAKANGYGFTELSCSFLSYGV